MDPDEPNWRLRAACRHHDPELWFPDPSDVGTREAAMRICRGCPVTSRCHSEARRCRAKYGVWAGEFINKLTSPADVMSETEANLARYRSSVERRANR